jgi:hypothetical protein
VRQLLACFQTIWNWRNGNADAEAPWSYPVARSALQGRPQSSLSSAAGGIGADLPAARKLRHLLVASRRFFSAPAPPWHPISPTGDMCSFSTADREATQAPEQLVLLCFVWSVSLLAASSLVWSPAEYLGLVTGLAADRHCWRPLLVVGDIQLIITQLRYYRPPKNTVLRRFYHSARRLADGLGITRW